ncbi:MAG: hypothetical protein ACJ76X_00300 [Solirubrobacteraceae bacterium]
MTVLLALPLTSLGDGHDPVGDTVNGLLNAVPQVTHVVQSVISPPQASSPAPAPAPAPQPAASSSGGGGGGGGGGGSSSVSRASAPSASRAENSSPNTPAMYGTNPHGQGTVAGVAVSPSTNVPYPYDPNGSGGEVTVLGRGRSEQTTGGSYHAHTTILDLLGHEVLGVDAIPGQSNTGPLDAIQTGLLDKVCSGSAQLACLSVLAADTSATGNSANTHFSLAHATIAGLNGIDVGIAEANSAISTIGSCQSASGNSSVANVNIAGGPVASAAKSSESSTACSGQAPAQNASSSVIGLGGTGLPVPAQGCDNGTPNSTLTAAGLLTAICNAENTIEAAAPSGVREALTAIVLPAAGTALLKTVTSASESHAVAPNVTGSGNGGGNGGANGGGNGTGGNGGNGGNGGAVGGEHTHTCTAANDTGNCEDTGGANAGAQSGENGENPAEHAINEATAGELPFTGENLLKLVLVGLVLGGVGLALNLRARES